MILVWIRSLSESGFSGLKDKQDREGCVLKSWKSQNFVDKYTALREKKRKKFLMEEIKWEIPRISGDPLPLTLKNGNPLFIVGPNGSGKSALIQKFYFGEWKQEGYTDNCPQTNVVKFGNHQSHTCGPSKT